MISWLGKIYADLQINLLIIFRPAVLFDKINQLGWYKNTLHHWIDDQNFPVNSKVLDVGCATGALTAYLAKAGFVPTGVDLSRDMIKAAKHNNTNIEYSEADIMKLPFATNCFDIVLATSLLNIVDNKTKAINELSRTCKKGGTITILVPSENFSDTDLQLLQLSSGVSGLSAAMMKAWHKNSPKMKASDLDNLFKQAGLTEIMIKRYLYGMVISVLAIKPL